MGGSPNRVSELTKDFSRKNSISVELERITQSSKKDSGKGKEGMEDSGRRGSK